MLEGCAEDPRVGLGSGGDVGPRRNASVGRGPVVVFGRHRGRRQYRLGRIAGQSPQELPTALAGWPLRIRTKEAVFPLEVVRKRPCRRLRPPAVFIAPSALLDSTFIGLLPRRRRLVRRLGLGGVGRPTTTRRSRLRRQRRSLEAPRGRNIVLDSRASSLQFFPSSAVRRRARAGRTHRPVAFLPPQYRRLTDVRDECDPDEYSEGDVDRR
mmetsp:Transcript_11418/g.33658  ORF Transcript_11418/g.33658 Transcript_11418/m.33658 type:complete len:211 (+) Transcript_11418:1426-2058(+)